MDAKPLETEGRISPRDDGDPDQVPFEKARRLVAAELDLAQTRAQLFESNLKLTEAQLELAERQLDQLIAENERLRQENDALKRRLGDPSA
jgi:septal ring factor EnvC (AmiA/AmiB activator)